MGRAARLAAAAAPTAAKHGKKGTFSIHLISSLGKFAIEKLELELQQNGRTFVSFDQLDRRVLDLSRAQLTPGRDGKPGGGLLGGTTLTGQT